MEYDVDSEVLNYGFIKLALMTGTDLVPQWNFGEVTTYHNGSFLKALRMRLAPRGVPGILPFGCWWCPLMPRRVPLLSVFGKRVDIPHIPNPTREEVREHAARYCDALRELYDEYKFAYYSPEDAKTRSLVIFNEPKKATSGGGHKGG
jgi:2-acylglycerol O-acyltransferase 2